MFLYFLIIISAFNWNVLADTFTIGALFHDDHFEPKLAFQSAIARHNRLDDDIKFETKIRTINRTDSFAAKNIVCEMVSEGDGVVAIFGPESYHVSPMVASICRNLEIPHLNTNYNPKIITSHTVFNLYPDPHLLALGIAAVVRNMNWRSYTIIYQSIDGLVRLQEVLKISTPDSHPVMIRQLPDNHHDITLFEELIQSEETNFILDCDDKDDLFNILTRAKEVGMLQHFHNYLITTLDAHTLDLRVIKASSNITMIRLVDPENPQLHNVVRNLERWELEEQQFQNVVRGWEATAGAALMYDAVNFFAMSFRKLHSKQHFLSRPLSCEAPEAWQNGSNLADRMKVRSMPGVTGLIKFNELGMRSQFTFEVVAASNGNMEKTATWTSEDPNNLKFITSEKEILKLLEQRLVIVASRIGAPYLMYRQPRYDGEILEGNDRFEGYSMDLIHVVSRILNFTYKFELTEDGAYGSYDPKTKTWNGLIRDLLEKKAHLAIADLTITHQRRAVVDFSLPFMTSGISILHTKSKRTTKNVFPFMEVDLSIWIYVIIAFISITLALYLIARMAPGDWENRNPHKSPENLVNKWTLKNSLWLIFSSTFQGCDIYPKGISSRMVISMWWLSVIVFTSAYTASLLVYLNYGKPPIIIEGVESLANQNQIKYGTVNGGSTQAFFRESNYSIYAKMWTQMKHARPSVFVSSNQEGVQRVLEAKNQEYAFLMETPSLEYVVNNNCELKQVGTKIATRTFGIAMPLNSPYSHAINSAVLRMQEEGTLSMLKRRWWNKGSCVELGGNDDHRYPGQLKLVNFGGIFYILLAGVSVALLFSFIDFLWNVRVVSLEQKEPYRKVFISEMEFAVSFWKDQKKKRELRD